MLFMTSLNSGGPLTILEAGTLTQIGVVSFGASTGCDLPYPSGKNQ